MLPATLFERKRGDAGQDKWRHKVMCRLQSIRPWSAQIRRATTLKQAQIEIAQIKENARLILSMTNGRSSLTKDEIGVIQFLAASILDMGLFSQRMDAGFDLVQAGGVGD